MADFFSRVTTKAVLAVMVVSATLVFNGIALVSGRPLDAATMALAGAVIGHYFRNGDAPPVEPELPEPFTGDDSE